MAFLLRQLADADPQFLRIVIAVTNALIAITTVVSALAKLAHYLKNKDHKAMTKKGTNNADAKRKSAPSDADTEDLLDGQFAGEFVQLPEGLTVALGTICRLALVNGGYFGLSVTDDGITARLALRTGKYHVDRRFYRLPDLEAALAKCLEKLRL